MYVRKIKKSGKVYLYYYKSQRIGNKVKSIYVGRALEKPKQLKQVIQKKSFKNTELIDNLVEFDKILFEITRLITIKDLKNSINVYNKMLQIYSKLDIQPEDKKIVFNKLSSTYNELVNLSKEHNIEVLR